ncbi:hypothetical protein [Burkholderia seminalis]|uniref:hypothetical protein n=1 Tax=Burkholderia seminalis TaxID=488731 RepID=UPI001906DE35|nr:hypothetical protein [Burkholderia seminalis]MBJ9967195.1 hypothetical protein [Burkholderia seminalis]
MEIRTRCRDRENLDRTLAADFIFPDDENGRVRGRASHRPSRGDEGFTLGHEHGSGPIHGEILRIPNQSEDSGMFITPGAMFFAEVDKKIIRP